MTRLKGIYVLEGLCVILILANLLFYMLPHFLANQKYGIMQQSDTNIFFGQWSWENSTSVKSGASISKLRFIPTTSSGMLSCKFRLVGPVDSIGFIFGINTATQWGMPVIDSYGSWRIGRLHDQWVAYVYLNPFELNQFSYNTLSIDPYQWNDLRIQINNHSQTMQGFINGQQIVEYKNSSIILSGCFGLETTYTVAEFKDITITPVE